MTIYKIDIRQFLIKSIKMHILNTSTIIDKITRKNVLYNINQFKKLPWIHGKTIFNNVNNDVKSITENIICKINLIISMIKLTKIKLKNNQYNNWWAW